MPNEFPPQEPVQETVELSRGQTEYLTMDRPALMTDGAMLQEVGFLYQATASLTITDRQGQKHTLIALDVRAPRAKEEGTGRQYLSPYGALDIQVPLQTNEDGEVATRVLLIETNEWRGVRDADGRRGKPGVNGIMQVTSHPTSFGGNDEQNPFSWMRGDGDTYFSASCVDGELIISHDGTTKNPVSVTFERGVELADPEPVVETTADAQPVEGAATVTATVTAQLPVETQAAVEASQMEAVQEPAATEPGVPVETTQEPVPDLAELAQNDPGQLIEEVNGLLVNNQIVEVIKQLPKVGEVSSEQAKAVVDHLIASGAAGAILQHLDAVTAARVGIDPVVEALARRQMDGLIIANLPDIVKAGGTPKFAVDLMAANHSFELLAQNANRIHQLDPTGLSLEAVKRVLMRSHMATLIINNIRNLMPDGIDYDYIDELLNDVNMDSHYAERLVGLYPELEKDPRIKSALYRDNNL